MKLLRQPISTSDGILRHQYGIPVTESQTFLLVKRPSEVISKEKLLPFKGYIEFCFCLQNSE